MALQIARQWDIYVGRTSLDLEEELEVNGDDKSPAEYPEEGGRGTEDEGSKRTRQDEQGGCFRMGGSLDSKGLVCAKDNYKEMKKVILGAASYIMETAFML